MFMTTLLSPKSMDSANSSMMSRTFKPALQARHLGGVLEARQLVGAGDGQRVGARLGRLADALVREAMAAVGHDVGVQPHPAPAAAAAQGVLAVAGHLHQLHARESVSNSDRGGS